jgi:hypothetical protein
VDFGFVLAFVGKGVKEDQSGWRFAAFKSQQTRSKDISNHYVRLQSHKTRADTRCRLTLVLKTWFQ